MYLAFDPGETTGWAEFDDEGALLEFGQLNREELYDFLANRYREIKPPHTVIYEEYRILHKKLRQHAGSKVITLQIIGAIEAAAYSWCAKVKAQPAAIKKTAEAWSGMKPTGSHAHSHWIDAFNHGFYYLIANNVRENSRVKDYQSANVSNPED